MWNFILFVLNFAYFSLQPARYEKLVKFLRCMEITSWKLLSLKILKSFRLGVTILIEIVPAWKLHTKQKLRDALEKKKKKLQLKLKTRLSHSVESGTSTSGIYVGRRPWATKTLAPSPGHTVHLILQPPLQLSTTRGLRKTSGMGKYHFHTWTT